MTNITYIKKNAYAFLIVVVISLVLIILYHIIKPEYNVGYNFNPFPNIHPSDLPDAETGSGSCFNKLTPCDAEGKCSSCGESNYTCTSVRRKGEYELNNIQVPKGSWCLPKKENTQSCNLYTGKWLWTSNNCPGGQTQCQKCECLYPDLFDGDDCGRKKACFNKSDQASGSQLNNKLIGLDTAPEKFRGVEWDPNSGTDSEILQYNPYTFDEKTGKPWFGCECKGPGPYVRLPNDPYNCHIDPCWRQTTSIPASGASCSDTTCECKCNQPGSPAGGVNIPIGTLKGMCATESVLCKGDGATWNRKTQQCDCGTNNLRKLCSSDYVQRSGVDKCTDSKNLIGEECVNPCSPSPCQNCTKGGCCRIDPTTKTSSCDCSKADGPEDTDCDGKKFKYTFSGDKCQYEKAPNGTAISKQTIYVSSPYPIDECTGNKNLKQTNCIDNKSYFTTDSGIGYSTSTEICGTDPSPPPSCFFPESIIILKNGQKKMVRDIQKGDEVLTIKNGIIEYTIVKPDIFFEVKDEDNLWDYVIVKTKNNTLRITSDHRLFVDNYKNKMAKDLILGEKLYVVVKDKVIYEPILKITHTKLKGKYDCHTEEGTIVVDNILCSSHDSPLPQWLCHSAWSFLQNHPFMYKIIYKYFYRPLFYKDFIKNYANNEKADELFDNSFWLIKKDYT